MVYYQTIYIVAALLLSGCTQKKPTVVATATAEHSEAAKKPVQKHATKWRKKKPETKVGPVPVTVAANPITTPSVTVTTTATTTIAPGVNVTTETKPPVIEAAKIVTDTPKPVETPAPTTATTPAETPATPAAATTTTASA